ncbi:tyrosine-protein phosphatase [Cellulomonas sp. ACRRI]|uniref:tyrosine-protein phosphatase n=1 Tax=Cellulomonas sp. ACRRI TaxID=2918188 RepID=UPI001EF3552E|nr:tyrosine-protein phosphatase [Cellulomonas sp. ACRRI]MCG7285210.1 tyrosine-protein phosphatase [Cellulomonas sp. ACRRI]
MTTTTDLVLSAPVNLRDLGGIPVHGGVVRQGVAIRADDLSTITARDADALVAAGLTAVVDLRSPAEVAITGRGPLAAHPVGYHHIPLIADVGASTPDGFTHEGMGDMYVRLVEDAAPQLVTALTVMACATGATAFHCAAGRDRTGVLAAALLLTLGADDDAVVADYARTGPNMRAIMERTRALMAAMFAALDLDALTSTSGLLEGSMEVAMRRMLARLRERHGDPLAPLRAAGLGAETTARLRVRAVAA